MHWGAVKSSEGRSTSTRGWPRLGFRESAPRGRNELQGSSGPPGLCAKVLRPPDLFFLGHQEVIIIIITQPSQWQQAPCYANLITSSHRVGSVQMGKWRARERKRLKRRVTSQPQRQSQDVHPEQVQDSCCCVRSPGASCSRCPLCPPAFPTVSATPGTHMPVEI